MDDSGDNDCVENVASVPDFTHEALAHLQVQSDDFARHVESFLEAPEEAGRQVLCEDLLRFRNTLVLLEKNAAVFVAEELLTLLQADQQGELNSQAELARVLLLATDQLSEHVALLQQDPTVDSALPLLPLVNDSRACRGETLLSDMLVLAAGIELPEARIASLGENSIDSEADREWAKQRQSWNDRASLAHPRLAQRLLNWWSGDNQDAQRLLKLKAVAAELDSLAGFCRSNNYLDTLLPLFQASSLVARAIGVGELIDGPALRSLYAQLERCVRRSLRAAAPDDLLPGDLLRNYLYYLAQIESDDAVALGLRRRFRLDRIRQAARANELCNTPTIGVGYHLSRAIRNSISAETETLRVWLENSIGESSKNQPRLIRLRVRLRQLEPVLTLMGAPEALACIQGINADLCKLDGNRSGSSGAQLTSTSAGSCTSDDQDLQDSDSFEQIRQRLAESLLLLDVLLDKNARRSVLRSATPALPVTVQGEAVFVDMAIDACLREARAVLQEVSETLEIHLPAGAFSTGRCHALTQKIISVDQALQILPLPEVTPLLRGLGDLLTHLQLQDRQKSSQSSADNRMVMPIHEEIATLLVSLDYYLGCVLQPQASASQLLIDAEDALMNARNLLDGKSANDETRVSEGQTEDVVARLLPLWDAIGAALSRYKGSANAASLVAIGQSLKSFNDAAVHGASPAIELLAASATRWFQYLQGITDELNAEQLTLLDEVHGVIPQLIDQWLSHTEDVRGLDELLDKLEDLETTLGLHETGGLTLTIDDDLLPDPLDDSVRLALDNTLQHVFHYECLGHLEELESSIRSALQPSAGITQRLPTEQMLRSLHTLAGSAQAVDAPYIAAIVQPLQRAALARQREGSSFDAPEARYIGELLAALRARLNSLATGESVEPEVEAVEARLSAFVARIIPGSDAADSGLGLASNVRSLDDVFGEEAGDLLDRLRLIVHSEVHGPGEIRSALALLHTLKGSARMAGRVTIAEHAHVLESELKKLHEAPALTAALKAGYATLRGLTTQASAQLSVTGSGGEAAVAGNYQSDSLLVSDSAFEGLLDLATDVTVNQARLSDALERMREVYHDMETTSHRWRALPESEHQEHSPAVAEMFADLQAACLVMRDALNQAEREQPQASRAAASLQQTLIRTRLVRVDEARERLSQAVQDALEMTHCQAQVIIEGGEVTLDRGLFRKLLASLEHLARNAIVHGIETESERGRAGKSLTGTIRLSASIDGTDLVLDFSDDGRGINRQELNKLLAASAEPLVETHEDLQATLFRSGFSSIKFPTALAGHGLGLSAVQAVVEQLGGQVQLASRLGEGTRISLRIPQRMVVNQVVVVECEGALFAIPVSQVEAVRMAGATVETPPKHRLVALAQLLSRQVLSDASLKSPSKAAVLVSVSGQELALEIDRVIGYRELVTQALGPQLATLHQYSGGSILSDGRQVLILDLNSVVEALGRDQRLTVKPARESLRPVALVVDDSLTMRTAAARVLQRCGIAVRQSRNGVEAMESMATAIPNLIILDMEMPQLDGYGFLKRILEEYAQACPPVIVISSRDKRADQLRMEKLGIVRFLSKPYSESQLQAAVEAAGLRLADLTIA
ncbi:response regulator [Granulosicoccus antarcticus]|uniref:histidine kinase n=1 Tax=Granulosicoccus antarcticus IMCC3135 TaxID=1192854 RepID=A0A2Z2NW04_9GAMM|nr:response regulator [Granulosicoccus antarcticus]ASJ71334.1 Gliding motility regulatory protein [Granulosicoccus antarcticus IMCC3135]